MAFDLVPLSGKLLKDIGNTQKIDGHIARFVDTVLDAAAPEALLPHHPFPVLRTHDFVLAYGSRAITRDGVGDCGTVLMRRRRNGMVSAVARSDAMQTRQTEISLWQASQGNFRAVSGNLVLQEYDYGVMSIEIKDHDWLGGSLLLSPPVLHKALERLGIVRAFVCAPSRLSVDIVDADSPDAFDRVQRWTADRLSESLPQSGVVFAFSQDDPRLVPRYASRGGRLIGAVSNTPIN